jgi:ABC-type multidrug transport system fused ATPase/permease subunit
MVRQSAEVTNLMVAVERLHEFGHSIPLEAPLVTSIDKDQDDWPKEPSVVFQNVCARYRDNLPLCLNNLSFRIQPGERVGIVGRTGAGKTSLLQVLFRVLEAEKGSITIGGVDISELGLHKLRTNMAVITQSPVLFSGCSIRENLDPYPKHFGKAEDKRLEDALRAVHMWDTIESIPNGLDGVVSEGGSNFSVGQRQLLCLARALLAESHILVLDEATANVDQVTDTLLQETLRERFGKATLIAIAHRLDTIIDYDKVLVLGNGRLLEFGAPADLLEAPNGHFASMVASTGQTMAEILRQKTKKNL